VLGDCWHRFYVRMLEVVQSMDLVRQAIDRYSTAEGDWGEPIKLTQKLPKGEAYLETECPRGQMGFYLVSDGSSIPWRCAPAAARFCNLSVICRGVPRTLPRLPDRRRAGDRRLARHRDGARSTGSWPGTPPVEVVAVRRHARGGPGGQLRSAAGAVRDRARDDLRHHEPDDDRQYAGGAGSPTGYVFHDPFTFFIFWVFFTCAVASVNRAPFDLAEAESELVAGFHTEYSGLRWSFFFMAEYGSMFLVSALADDSVLRRLERSDSDLPRDWLELSAG
jgi:hypothetical protein